MLDDRTQRAGGSRAGRRVRALAAAAASAALAVAGCGGSDSSGSAATTPADRDPFRPEATTLDGAMFRATASAGFLAAEDGGFARRYGIRLVPRYVEDSAAAVSQLISGDVQVGYSSYFGVIDATRQGLDLRIVSEAMRSVPELVTLEVLPDSPIRGLADFEGKKVAVTSVNSSLDVKIKTAMEEEGLDPSKVEFVELPYGEMGSALQRGTIDVASVTGVAQAQVRRALRSRKVWDYGAERFEGFAESAWVMPAKFVDENPNTVAAFQCAIQAGQQQVLDDDSVYGAILTRHLEFDEATIAASPKPGFQVEIRPDRIAENSELMETLGLIDEPFDLRSLIVPMPDDCDAAPAG